MPESRLDGFWSVAFDAGVGPRQGVAFIHAASLSGGDSDFYWWGWFAIKDEELRVHLEVEYHDGAVHQDVFGGGVSDCALDLRGKPPNFPENP